ncbi:hypothetical protein BDP27DRAFT_1340522 [Rhodocollybia butyracea]|uniref:Phospholipid/glycerol acyltransferase domain-containing protein n=1 Tax=Rhodocollybia butyracea TaxID=206335 RepID=A0A9P5PAJ1_9AGAR|nr:hypothetical protein BDP27DRAFT_1340522 [Rhodocollybia butyracea]
MELKLVYRALRKVSDWTVTGYYSEVVVEGQENILNIQHDTSYGPVIIGSTHHNEMIDIATLSMTMPKAHGERRHVSFWAKESMFRNPVGGWVMRSSGAIPVKRNLDKSEVGLSGQGVKESNGSESLFSSTIHALSLGGVVGVFPEGTSYTQPGIVQVLPGTARAAVEYEFWRDKSRQDSMPGDDVVIVPVGIVYTDKSQYQSRLLVRYGKPIRIKEVLSTPTTSSLSSSLDFSTLDTSANSSSFSLLDTSTGTSSPSRPPSTLDTDAEAVSATRMHSATKDLASRLERALFGLTINAPDWETLYAAGVARDIIFENKELALRNWVPVSQLIIDLLSPESELVIEAKHALTRYFALLHHTGLSHAVLNHIFPLPAPTLSTFDAKANVGFLTASEWMSYQRTTFRQHLGFSTSVAKNAAHAVAILPVLPIYAPAFLVSHLTVRCLATPGEEEGEAQFRAVGGGVGLGIGLAIGRALLSRICTNNAVLKVGARVVSGRWFDIVRKHFSNILPLNFEMPGIFDTVYNRLSALLTTLDSSGTIKSFASRSLEGLGWLMAAWFVVKWYGFFIKRAHMTYRYTLSGPARSLWVHHLYVLLFPWHYQMNYRATSRLLQDSDVIPYTTLPPPPTNAFIRKRARQNEAQSQVKPSSDPSPGPSSERSNVNRPGPIPTSKLILSLLLAREEARRAVFSLDGFAAAVKAL